MHSIVQQLSAILILTASVHTQSQAGLNVELQSHAPALHHYRPHCSVPCLRKSSFCAGQVIGYTVIPGAPSAEGTDIVAEHLWSFSMRSRLLEAVPVTQSAQTGHHVKVHGDRSISFRYLSPNMALLVSQAHTGIVPV